MSVNDFQHLIERVRSTGLSQYIVECMPGGYVHLAFVTIPDSSKPEQVHVHHYDLTPEAARQIAHAILEGRA